MADGKGIITDPLFKLMASERESAPALEIIKSDLENNLLYIKGSIPGSKNSEVLVKKSVKNIKKLTTKEKIEASEKLKKVPEKKKKEVKKEAK